MNYKNFDELFENIPMGRTVHNRIKEIQAVGGGEILNRIARKIQRHKAEPWVFTLDENGFFQHATPREHKVITMMTDRQREVYLYLSENC